MHSIIQKRLQVAFLLGILVSFARANTISNNSDNEILKTKGSSASASASASSSSSSCFARDTLVTLTNGNKIPIGHLRPGDELITSDGFSVIGTQMMMMLDQDQFSLTLFYTILTASGNNISLTGLHLLPIMRDDDTFIYVPANQVKVGDILRVLSNGQLVSSPVVRLILEMKTGFYAPLTTTGTILVNDVAASCYANVQSHDAAHFYMGPLRWYNSLARSLSIAEPFGHQKSDGIHIVPRVMYEFARLARPSTLRFV
ncbi:hypothetical protein I4U23_005637 [Adineta vaga]|nr:hypothetical protein I4U23_005637 [Adineta vaga]